MDSFMRRRYCHDGVCRARGVSRRWYDVAAITIVGILVASVATLAHDSEEQFADWYLSLKAPESGMSCCSMRRDCATIDDYHGSATVPGGYEVLFEGEWLAVSPSAVLQRSDNPTGHAVLCVSHQNGKPVARCFVRGSET